MKKTLVAIATLTAFGAQAQSSVVLDGYIDRAYVSVNNSLSTKNAKGIAGAAGTTTFGIKVREDLSSDLSVGLTVNTDWADLAGLNQDANTIANVTTQKGGFANSASFADLTSKSMGTLRLGSPNNFTLTNATGVASPAFSTGYGSSYSTHFSIANGVGTGTDGSAGIAAVSTSIATQYSVANAGQRAIRIANTVQYSSPSINGASVHVGRSFKNDNATVGSATSTAETVGVTEMALRYTNGPIDAMYTSIRYDTPSTATTNTSATSINSTQNLLGVSYSVTPSLKLHAGSGNFNSTSETYKGSSMQYGVTYNMGTVIVMAQSASVNDTSTTNMDRKLTGLGIDYPMSKTARAYLRYDAINWNTNGTTIYAGTTQKRTAIGLSKSF
jgi:hypothetical protein